jgi:hypothetical protein
VSAARALIARHPALLIALLACALALRVIVPVGFMPVVAHGSVSIELCPDFAAVAVAAPMHGMHHDGEGPHHQGKPTPTCAFSGLGFSALGAADAVLLAGAILYVFALVFAPRRLVLPAPPSRLRPPLRAPPVTR